MSSPTPVRDAPAVPDAKFFRFARAAFDRAAPLAPNARVTASSTVFVVVADAPRAFDRAAGIARRAEMWRGARFLNRIRELSPSALRRVSFDFNSFYALRAHRRLPESILVAHGVKQRQARELVAFVRVEL